MEREGVDRGQWQVRNVGDRVTFDFDTTASRSTIRLMRGDPSRANSTAIQPPTVPRELLLLRRHLQLVGRRRGYFCPPSLAAVIWAI